MRRVTLIAAVVFASQAACAPAWTVIKQATPSPLLGQKQIVLEAVNFDKVPQLKEDMKKEIQASWDKEFKNSMKALTVLDKAPEDGSALVVRGAVTAFKEGTIMDLAMDPTYLNMSIQIAKGADVLDEITIGWYIARQNMVMGVPVSGFTAEQRLGEAADNIAETSCEYIDSRLKAP
jgi:hypothetical protein